MTKTLYQSLKEYDKTMLPMHMPGHKRNLALSGKGGYLEALCANCDITEIAGFDNLAEPEEVLLSLKKRAAALWHSAEAYPLVNGSTCGVLAAIYATVGRGEAVILARNCHKSVYNGVQLAGARVTYLLPEQEATTGIFGGITAEAVEEAFAKATDAKLVIVTSPTYEGVISDVEGICRVAHAHGVPVLVDSAHGAHLGFGSFPKGAVEFGADLVVHSLHKTMPSLTQTAMLHRNGTLVSGEEVQAAINLFQTSSPSYLLMASIEGCIGLMEEKGEKLFADWQNALEFFYREVRGLRHLSVMGAEMESGLFAFDGGKGAETLFFRDPSKLVICTGGTGRTGTELADKLRKDHHIEAEMAAERYVIAMTGMGDTKESLKRLAAALLTLDENDDGNDTGRAIYEEGSLKIQEACPEQVYAIAEAKQKVWKEKKIRAAVGDVAAEHIWAYPPGIPVVVAGERITKELVACLEEKVKNGIELHRNGGVIKGPLTIKTIDTEGRLCGG